MKRLLAIILCIVIIAGLSSAAFAATDAGTIQNAIIALGIMTGDENGNMNLSGRVTRAEFAKLLVSASVYKDTVQEGSGSSLFKDVKHNHWASGYIGTAVRNGWMSGYIDGTFRPDESVTYEQAASSVLKLLGYDTSDLPGSYPKAQISKFASLKLNKGISPTEGKALTRNDCMYIFYNLMGASTKNGQVYGVTLGHKMNKDGEIDYDALIEAETLEGPFVISSSAQPESLLPFNSSQATVYRNNRLSQLSSIVKYDVVYYNEYTKTVWAYSNRAVGLYTAVSPNAISPASVTVSGNNYSLSTSNVKNKFSVTGEFVIGDMVALLLGKDGDAVDAVPAAEIDAIFYGVVIKYEFSTFAVDASRSNSEHLITVACTDGIARQCVVPGNYYTVGNVVSISYAKGECKVERLGSNRLSGKVNNAATQLGDYHFAQGVEIMDVSKDGSRKLIFPSRLSGITLESGNILFYALNNKKEITHLILNDVTGDLHSYGILTNIDIVETQSGGGFASYNATYRYIINGTPGVLSTSGTRYSINRGPAIFYYSNGQINNMKNLTAVSIRSLSEISVTANNQRYEIAETVQVYIQSSGNTYNRTDLSAINTNEYTLTGYYETIYPAGGQIRIIIAAEKVKE